jgi:hypothetical protein
LQCPVLLSSFSFYWNPTVINCLIRQKEVMVSSYLLLACRKITTWSPDSDILLSIYLILYC